jgi:uncharacterized protein
VTYLLDVSALVAFGLFRHTFHHRVIAWVRTLESKGVPELATCSITELGLVRVLAQSPEYGLTVADARSLLQELKAGTTPKFTFFDDDQDISLLPTWVTTGGQTTDGHLLQLAKAHGLVFATLDTKIPGAFLIPA